jgi:hypothetical protein
MPGPDNQHPQTSLMRSTAIDLPSSVLTSSAVWFDMSSRMRRDLIDIRLCRVLAHLTSHIGLGQSVESRIVNAGTAGMEITTAQHIRHGLTPVWSVKAVHGFVPGPSCLLN